MTDATDLAEQALLAKEQGIGEVLRLLQHPEDLSRLADITGEYESRHRSAKSTLSAMVQSQVEATRLGMEMLERAHRHILKLQAALDRIDRLCAECSDLVHHHDKIKLLATTHGNVKNVGAAGVGVLAQPAMGVLLEIEDIVDLPYRADRCWDMLQADEANLVPAFEALLLLTGTAENAKQAWQRSNKSAADLSELSAYLARVDDVMRRFEELLFGTYLRLPDFIQLSQERPTLLVDCVRVMELQELLDSEYRRVKMGAVPQRRYKDRFFAAVTTGAQARFEELVEVATACNQPNTTVKYDQNGDVVVSESRDYLGSLTRLVRVVDGQEEVVDDPDELRSTEVIEESIFDEDVYLDDLLNGLYDVTDELASVYDYTAPCFPPSYDIFNRVFQTYHVQFSVVVDVLGHGAAEGMSTKGALRVMDCVQKYMDTLRNLGVDEELVRLPPSPLGDPDSLPGVVVLMESYVGRMESTVTSWYNNILDADLRGEPKVTANGTLCTLGVVDFFRILNQQIAIIEALNDHGEVMFRTARQALGIMRGFQAAQRGILGGAGAGPGRQLSLEMAVAFLNNNVTCYDQSLVFAEDVQRQLDKAYREQLDVEGVCRGFLDVAKAAAQRAVQIMFNDPGMSTQLKGLYGTGNADYLSGRTTSTLIATLRDYFSDFQVWVLPSFVKRVAEAGLEELVRRAVNMFVAGPPQATEALVRRMEDDEADLMTYFESYVKLDRLRKHISVLADMRELLVADSAETFTLSYTNLLALQKAFTLEVVTKLLTSCRSDLTKKQVSDITAQCKELWRQREVARKAAKEDGEKNDSWGFFGWGKK